MRTMVQCIDIVKVTGDPNVRAGRVTIRLCDPYGANGNSRPLPRGRITLRMHDDATGNWLVWHEPVFALLPARVLDPDLIPSHIATALQAAALVQFSMNIMPFRRCFLGADIFTADGIAPPPGRRLGTNTVAALMAAAAEAAEEGEDAAV